MAGAAADVRNALVGTAAQTLEAACGCTAGNFGGTDKDFPLSAAEKRAVLKHPNYFEIWWFATPVRLVAL